MQNLIHHHATKLYSCLAKIGFLISMAILPSIAYADCGANNPPVLMGFTSIERPARDAPLITPISQWSTASTTLFHSCTLWFTYFFHGFVDSIPVRGYYFDPSDGINYPILNIDSTASKGIPVGYIAAVNINDSGFIPISGNRMQIVHKELLSSSSVKGIMKIRLVRYGPLPPATNTLTLSLNWTHISYGYTPDINKGNGKTFVGGTVRYTFSNSAEPTCSVSTQNLVVNLPAIDAKRLSSIGATTGDTPFTLLVNCPGTTPINVYMTLTDNKLGQTNYSTALSSSTEGVGVQIRDLNRQAITLGPDSSIAGNPGQFLVRNNFTGITPIPFIASYIRTGTGVIKPGKLTAVATFTMSYQ
ncbi:fimbrial protein precursor [Aquitalea magnusonii]|uniref:Fimbrial protein n=1 Tax=Aquitalea magnusonii TaxID=332411 RepID=A0A3G9GBF4_9NEIS|nr:fimbrial protein [Aquitalea magnusonii]BBF84143.1 fimbrial protein precursor [Aquitalea magnusonii]